VDDAFALLLAFHSPNLKIAGISTTYGNAPLAATTRAAQALISKLEGRPAIYPGANSRNDLGRETEASRALAATVREKRSLTYIALGPLTNLASFQLRHPDLARLITRVIFIGGTTPATTLRFGTRHPIRIHDANVVKDPAAVAQVLRSRIPTTLVSIETAALLQVTATDLDAMRAYPAGGFIQKNSRFWLWFWTKYVGTEGGPIFDAAAVLAVTDPKQLGIETRSASVDAGGNLVVEREPRPGGRKVSCVVKMSKRANATVARRLRSR
jgi:inosine-uridine nucleoside N-ribohydrolase